MRHRRLKCQYVQCLNMVYGQLRITPLHIDIKVSMIVYWAKLISGDQSKISQRSPLHCIN